jgi:succinate dehydrogenase/fumarate reductase flavoprotein subunit
MNMHESVESSETVDVVVVGAGDAGLMAAIEAADLGANVVVLQKLAEPGGKSALAIGSISAAGTSLQRAHGIVDDDEIHLRDLLARIQRGKIEPLSMLKLELAVRHGAAAIERLIGLGVQFSGPHPEMADELSRMHVITPDARALVSTLAQQARRRGVRIRGDWAADKLVADDSGRVIGVTGQRGTIYARRHVVLATGDFSAPPRLGEVGPIGSDRAFRPWSSGDGHYLAQSVGAKITHLDRPLRPQVRAVDWPHIEPHPSVLRAGGIIVDRNGRRVADETGDLAAAVVAAEHDRDLFLILDARVADLVATIDDDSGVARDGWLTRRKLYLATFPGVAYGYRQDVIDAGYGANGESVDALAAALGISATGLNETISAYNLAIEQNRPDEFGREARVRLSDRPGLFGCGPFRIRAILGRAGITTDEELRVLDQSGRPIRGLLAAGAVAGVTGFAYGHGYELAWAVVSGRIAGQNAAGPR